MAGITLAAARVNVRLSQKEAATKLNVSNKTLCNWENGKSFPKPEQINAICALYGVQYDDLIFLPSKSALSGT